MGETASRWTVKAMIAAQYALAMYLVATGFLPWPVLAVARGSPVAPICLARCSPTQAGGLHPEYRRRLAAVVCQHRLPCTTVDSDLYLIGLVAGAILF